MGHYIKDKVVIVTGGTSGFGLEAAKILLQMDAKVVITGRNRERLDLAAKELDHENLLPVQADACQTQDWKTTIEKTLDKFGRIDVLVNNHGAGIKVAEVENLTDNDIRAILDINLASVIKGCREVVKVMKKQGSGHIVNVSSGCAHQSCNFIPGAARTGFCDAVGIDDAWLEGYPGAYEFARTLVHCIDVPENSMIEEVSIWGTKQVKDMLNPF
ncbi:MAG: SDR family oxidoreductase [Planctomycetota bacterium]|jgi:NADP-dependent 3-hydroxy acid dehydrogenase YdfG